MIRLLFFAVMLALASSANAHGDGACNCCGKVSDESFRETLFNEVFPLTREMIASELLVEEAGFDDPRLRNRVTVPLMEHRRLLRDLLTLPIDDDTPPVYFDSPSDEMTAKSFDQLVQGDLLPSTLAKMRLQDNVHVMTFGGIAFQR